MAEPNGLYYMRARYYDPSVGRFISEDPLGFGGGMLIFLRMCKMIRLTSLIQMAWPHLEIFGENLESSNTVVGIIWGGIGVPFGAKVTIGNNAIQFENHPFMPEGGAITFGNAISYGKQACPTEPLPNGTFGKHEQQHTYQGELLGPLYLPSNILGLSAGEMLNGDTHGEQIGMKVVRSLFLQGHGD